MLQSAGRDEGGADAPAFLGAHRDVLQVGVAGGEPSRHHRGLREVSMHSAGFRVDHARQLVGVGALEFGQAAVFEQQLGQRVVERQFGEHFLVGRRRAGRGFLLDRQAQFFEQDVGQLLGRGEVEGLAGQFVGLRFEGHDLPAHFVALAGQLLAVDQDAGALHLPDDLAGRHFDIVIDARQAGFVGEARMQHLMHAQRDVGILGGVGGGAFDDRPGRSRSAWRPCRTGLRRRWCRGRGGGCTADRGHGPCRTR